MSKYKVGDTIYVECVIDAIVDESEPVVRTKEWGIRFVPSEGEIHAKTYADGLADAWEAARKVCLNKADGGLPEADMNAIFGNDWRVGNILRGNDPQEAIAKIKEWEDRNKIKQGDEVTDGTFEGVVTRVRDMITVMWKDGDTTTCDKAVLTKTGRNLADKLDALLAEIGGDTNGQD